MNTSRPIIVTGVSSFIGAHLARFLAARGNKVIATCSRPRQAYTSLEAERLCFAESAGAVLENIDITDDAATEDLIRRYKPIYWISHAGWAQDHSSSDYDIELGHITQISPYSAIFAALKSVGCQGVVSTGSGAEYHADEDGSDEDDFRWPDRPYGLTKLTKTIRFRQLAAEFCLPVRIARIFNPLGILENSERLVSSVADALIRGLPLEVSDASLERDFIHIEDVCAGYLALLQDCRKDIGFDVFNICGGEPVRLERVVELLAAAFGRDPSQIRFGQKSSRKGEPRVVFGLNEKARTQLNWTPLPFESAIEKFAREYMLWADPSTSRESSTLTNVRLSRCSTNSNDIRRVSSTLRRGFLGMGAETEAFESELKSYIGGNREVICVNTGTSALHLAVQACGIGPGDEVLLPTVTFVASFQAVSATGATPIACDVRKSDGYICLEDAKRRLTPRTRAIMPVHYAGSALGVDAVYTFAQTNSLRVIEDAAHAFGGAHDGRKIGSFGDIACFSFDGIKNITAGEGGAIVTSDTAIAEKIRDARLLGVIKDTEKRYQGKRSWDFDVTAQGWRYHMSNINAALGRSQLHRLDSEFAPRRRAIAHEYRVRLGNIPGIRLFDFDWEGMVPHIFPVRILNANRDTIRSRMAAVNIETGIHYKPNHLLSLYRREAISLPVSEQLNRELLTLPIHAELSAREQDRTITIIVDLLHELC